MKKIKYRLVYNRKKKLNSEGKALIQVEAYLQGSKIYISTHIYINPNQWNQKQKRIIQHEQADELNRFLEECILMLQIKELEGWKKGLPISLELLKDKGNNSTKETFFLFGRKWVENSSRKESTKQNIKTTLSLLEECKPDLKIEELNYSFLLEFEQFLLGRHISVNTIAKHMCHLKSLINEAVRQDLISSDNSPFKYYKIKKVKTCHKYLLPEEVYKLECARLTEKHAQLQHSLDAFLFCCYTGLRYSDFIHIQTSNIVKISPNKTWLNFQSKKTGVYTQIPLYLLFHGKALDILKKYPDKNRFFHFKSNSDINKDLIRLGKICGIKKHFSFHTARHTNATLLIYKGTPITTVQKLLGHRSVKTTEIYSEILPMTIENDLKKCSF